MTISSEELTTAFSYAAGLWPKAFEPGSEGVQIAWGNRLTALEWLTQYDLCAAFEALVERGAFPQLSDLLEECRVQERLRIGRERANAIDDTPKLPASTHKLTELEKFVKAMELDGIERKIGPHEAAAYRIVRDGGIRTVGTLWHKAREGESYPNLPAFLGAMEREAQEMAKSATVPGVGDTPAPSATQEPADSVQAHTMAENDNKADAIANEYLLVPRFWPKERIDQLDPALRTVVRERLANRLSHAAQSAPPPTENRTPEAAPACPQPP